MQRSNRLHLHANEGNYVRDSADWVWRPDYSPHSLLLAEPLMKWQRLNLICLSVPSITVRASLGVQGWQPMFGKVHGAQCRYDNC